jgi:plasmid stabilization system protein ParE
MVNKVKWADDAISEFSFIIHYYALYSFFYSSKIRLSILSNVNLLASNPYLGITTSFENIRNKAVGERFSVIYMYNEDQSEIHILRIWDNRRNPKKKFKDL